MSWDAYLTDDRGHCEGDWNYTHNTNKMATIVACETHDTTWLIERSAGWWDRRDRPDQAARYRELELVSWWHVLDGLSGADGAAFLDKIIKGLDADPDRFRALNPSNGWGDYDTFLKTLFEMRNAVPEWPTVWRVSG